MVRDIEIHRRMFHLCSGLTIVGLIYADLFDYVTAIVLLVLLLMIGIVVKKSRVPIASWFFERFDRPKDFEKLPGKGSVYYLIGTIIVLVLFTKDVAMASIMILALGDSLAPIIGQYGKLRNPFNNKKYIEGSIGGGLIAFIGAMLFVSPIEAFTASFFAMVVEGIDLKLRIDQIDDNILMPLTAGIIIWILRVLI